MEEALPGLCPPGPQDAEFELHCDGEFAASACGPRERAWSEVMHYAGQYAADGPLALYEVTRTRLLPAIRGVPHD